MFNEEDVLKLRRFCQSIISNPRSMDNQPCTRIGSMMWCEDWEIIEICKYLFHGSQLYHGDPPPNRLKNNTLWSKEDIAAKSEKLIEILKTADDIIEYLKRRRENVPTQRIAGDL